MPCPLAATKLLQEQQQGSKTLFMKPCSYKLCADEQRAQRGGRLHPQVP